ncbi:unnamed protein product [Effrenium voratum]|nr:unnamed protein product [Effrenium voratum]
MEVAMALAGLSSGAGSAIAALPIAAPAATAATAVSPASLAALWGMVSAPLLAPLAFLYWHGSQDEEVGKEDEEDAADQEPRVSQLGAGNFGEVFKVKVKTCTFALKAGTTRYHAPELALLNEAPTSAVDVWAAGVSIHRLGTGSLPLPVSELCAQRWPDVLDWPAGKLMSHTLAGWLREVLRRCPLERCSAGASLQLPFLAKAKILPTLLSRTSSNAVPHLIDLDKLARQVPATAPVPTSRPQQEVKQTAQGTQVNKFLQRFNAGPGAHA